MRRLTKITLIINAALTCVSCSSRNNYEDSLAAKEAYSVLESHLNRLNSAKPAGTYIFSRDTLGSSYDTLAFPIRSEKSSFFVIIANAEDERHILKVWKSDERSLRISRETANEIRKKGYASAPVQRYLGKYVRQ